MRLRMLALGLLAALALTGCDPAGANTRTDQGNQGEVDIDFHYPKSSMTRAPAGKPAEVKPARPAAPRPVAPKPAAPKPRSKALPAVEATDGPPAPAVTPPPSCCKVPSRPTPPGPAL